MRIFRPRSPSPCAVRVRHPLVVLGLACALGGVMLGAQAQTRPETKTEPRSETRQDPRAEGKAELTPPPGTMMGAYGQSLMQALPATAHASPATPGSTPGDSVARFLQDRGLITQDGAGSKLLNQVRDQASDLVMSAMNFLGVPYRRGGNSVANGFDCSGFTRHIFELSVGLVLPHRADEQARMSSLVSISREELKPGDLVFFNTMRRTFSHVGIYVGEGKFIHAPRAGSAVRVEDMREAYWAKRFTGARRADLSAAGADSGLPKLR